MQQYTLRLNKPAYWNTPGPAREEQLLQHWKDSDLAGQLRAARRAKPAYWLMDGPPYANGDAHLGHMLNKTLKDVQARYASACGYDVTWRAGWDCHGLPLELAVEKRHGPAAKDDPAGFLRQCRAEATHWKDRQAGAMARAGLLADMEAPWLTMDPAREAASLALLLELWQAGLLVERHSPVHWCPACQSALAASELERTDAERVEAYFTAPLSAASCLALRALAPNLPDEPLHLLSWTTTPWTLWSNAGFAYPEWGPVTVARLQSGLLVVLAVQARDRLLLEHPAMFREPGHEFDGALDFEQLGELGLQAHSPLTELEAPLLPAVFASEREGSGFVHLAPAFGPEDFVLHETHGVRLECHVGPDGRMLASLPAALRGLNLEAGSAASCELLAQRGRLVRTDRKPVEVNMCWRHKKPVFYRASQQWALDLHKPFDGCPEGLAQRATAALDSTQFVPDDNARAPLSLMMGTRRFWTLSRDRLWGLPLPFFRHEESGDLHPDTAAMWGELVDSVRRDGVEAWQTFPTPDGYTKSTQSVDVWFDSGAAWHSAGENNCLEADLVVEGQDQTRGWFLSSFLLHAFKSPLPPFKKVMTHRFVVDENGHKFSKSKGGTPDVIALFAKTGSDVFRLWVCGQSVSDEMRWSKTSLQQASQDAKDWRSFLRFHLANMAQDPALPQPLYLRPLDRLALCRMGDMQRQWQLCMEGGRLNHALGHLAQFRQWASAEWFELSKRTLYCARDGDADLRSAQWALRESFLQCAQMLATVMPFACEEAYLAWPAHPRASLFLHQLDVQGWLGDGDTDELERMLAWRRSLMPVVERARGLVDKGMPVCLAFAGEADRAREDQLRELFPGCMVVLGDSEDALADWVEPAVQPETFALVRAGRPGGRKQPNRCARCRGFFHYALNVDGCCGKCSEEVLKKP